MTLPRRSQTGIFISYSHQDEYWLHQLLNVLNPVIRTGFMKVWSDKELKPGTKWKDEIQRALAEADLAVPLVSPNYFSSEFIAAYELPILLSAAENGAIQLLWVAVSSSLFNVTAIAQYQAINDPAVPLDCLAGGDVNKELVRVAQMIVSAAQQRGITTSKPEAADKGSQNKQTSPLSLASLAGGIFISRLSRDSLAVYGESREEVNRSGQIVVRKPPPVMARISAQSYASMNLAALLIARTARSGDSLPDSVLPQIENLPGFRVDEDSFARDGHDIIYRAWLLRDEGCEKEVWARVGIVEYPP